MEVSKSHSPQRHEGTKTGPQGISVPSCLCGETAFSLKPRRRPPGEKAHPTMDFSLSPELQDLQRRTRDFIRDTIIPLESDPRQTAHGPTEEFRRELVALAREAGLLAPHVVAGVWRARPRPRRQGHRVRGSRLLPARPRRDAHLRARRGQHAPDGAGGDARAEGAVAAAVGTRRDAVVLLHDRAGAGRRIGSRRRSTPPR